MHTDSQSAVEPSRVSAPPIPKVLIVGEYTALGMTALALFGCLAALFTYTCYSLWQGTTIPEPQFTGTKEEYYRDLSTYSTKETYRQQARTEYRAAVTQSVAYLAGTALGFLAVALLLRAARTAAEGIWDQLGRFAPGMMALVCATLIFIFAVSHPSEPNPSSRPFPYPITTPTYVAPTVLQ
jgi:hypothetical protein